MLAQTLVINLGRLFTWSLYSHLKLGRRNTLPDPVYIFWQKKQFYLF